MLYVPPILDLDGQCGDWTRDELEEMDHRFVAAVERAFELGLESRAAAAATCAVNGKQRADEIAIELAWRWFADANAGSGGSRSLSRRCSRARASWF
jgi:hypothetical protein